MSDAYGFPEKSPRTLSLQEKIFSWTGRPSFAKKRLKNVGRIIEDMRNHNKRVNQLSADDFNRLNNQLSLFTQNLYRPFRRWFRTVASVLNISDMLGVGVNYFGISRSHAYIVFSKLNNPFAPIKGVDLCESKNSRVCLLANLGRISKNVADSLEKYGFTILHEDRDEEEEIIHNSGFKGKSRTHVHLGNYFEKDVISESEHVRSELSDKLAKLKTSLT
jgi:hypothetical protein